MMMHVVVVWPRGVAFQALDQAGPGHVVEVICNQWLVGDLICCCVHVRRIHVCNTFTQAVLAANPWLPHLEAMTTPRVTIP